MTDTITIRGFLGSPVRLITTASGLPIASFRLASTARRYDRDSEEWVNGQTNWYSVSAFRNLAQNSYTALEKGDPVIITGKLKIRHWESEQGTRGTAVDVDAESIGHDLTFGTSVFNKISASATTTHTESQNSADPTGHTQVVHTEAHRPTAPTSAEANPETASQSEQFHAETGAAQDSPATWDAPLSRQRSPEPAF